MQSSNNIRWVLAFLLLHSLGDFTIVESAATYRMVRQGEELVMSDPPIWEGKITALGCGIKCYKQSCALFVWDTATFGCQTFPTIVITSYASASGTSLQNYVLVPDAEKGFFIVPSIGSWEDARDVCKNEGAIIGYFPNNPWIKSLKLSTGALGLFTGLVRDEVDENVWYDMEGRDRTSEIVWSTGEPSGPNELCTAIFNGPINDVRCTGFRDLSALCKIP